MPQTRKAGWRRRGLTRRRAWRVGSRSACQDAACRLSRRRHLADRDADRDREPVMAQLVAFGAPQQLPIVVAALAALFVALVAVFVTALWVRRAPTDQPTGHFRRSRSTGHCLAWESPQWSTTSSSTGGWRPTGSLRAGQAASTSRRRLWQSARWSRGSASAAFETASAVPNRPDSRARGTPACVRTREHHFLHR